MANCKGLGGEGSLAAVLSHVLAVDYISEDYASSPASP
jgi:hypothetical protein